MGGVLFIVAQLAGWFEDPEYAAWFLRAWVYGVAEGPHLNPFLIFPRAYYTLSLAGCLWALHLVIAPDSARPWIRNGLSPMLIAVAVFLNARYGVFTLGLITLYYISAHRWPCRRAIPMVAGIVLGVLSSFIVMQYNPIAVENHLNHANMAMWFGPFVLACDGPFAHRFARAAWTATQACAGSFFVTAWAALPLGLCVLLCGASILLRWIGGIS